MKTIIVAPHPDDEILGAAGTLLRRKAEGGSIAWVIVTTVSVEAGWGADRVAKRAQEVSEIASLIGFDKVYQLGFSPAGLDRIPVDDLVGAISQAFSEFQPEEVLLPHAGDAHTDHQIVANAVASCTKWFRNPSIKRVMAYETISETDVSVGGATFFRPNVFVNIEGFLDTKVRALNVYASEVGAFPFPRSDVALRALAAVRGSASGFKAAEAFELLRERQ